MKKSNKGFSKLVFISILLFFISQAINAQSLPKIQEVSLRAPDNIKIDGKTLEWPNNRLSAYNSDNRIMYAVSNDDNNLYLTVRAPYYYGPYKIMLGGLTFTVSHSVDKKERIKATGNVAVTFPILEPKDASGIISSIGSYENMMHDTANMKKEHDSLVNVVNAKTTSAIKEIKVIGIKDIEDTAISIYNTTGLKAMGAFNRGMAFTIEMAIPLKYLGLSVNDGTKFSYNIKLNGKPLPPAIPRAGEAGPTALYDEMAAASGLTSVQSAIALNNFDYLHKQTDLWGEYTLAKKP